MAKSWPPKDPGDVDDFGFDWSPLIAPGSVAINDPIVDTGYEVLSGDIVVDSHDVGPVEDAPTGQSTITWLSGGTSGTTVIKLSITTAAGRTFKQDVSIKIKERA